MDETNTIRRESYIHLVQMACTLDTTIPLGTQCHYTLLKHGS